MGAAELPVLAFESGDAWEAWLRESHADSPGVWLKIAKKGSGIRSVTYVEAVEVALCYGWIDGQGASLDEEFWLQKLTPRRRRSIWSKTNRDRALALVRAGRMRPAGLREIERAKADGRWEAAYDSPRSAGIPHDLQEELDRHPAAAASFAALDARNRYAILFRIQTARRPATRASRIQKLVEMLAEGRKPYP